MRMSKYDDHLFWLLALVSAYPVGWLVGKTIMFVLSILFPPFDMIKVVNQ